MIKDVHRSSVSSTCGSVSGPVTFNPVSRFLACVNEPDPTIGSSIAKNKRTSSPTLPSTIKYLLSAQTLIEDQFGLPSNETAVEARFCGRLIMSIINSFAGPEISATGALRFLLGYQTIQSSMTIELFNPQLDPVAKAFAENIFQAALAADNVEVVGYLIKHSSFIDVNETVCHFDGRRYTPLQRASIAQSLGVIRLLIHLKADVNKIHGWGDAPNALLLLIIHREDRHSTFSNDFLATVQILLKAKATISMYSFPMIFIFTDPTLAILLLEESTPEILRKLISDRTPGKTIIDFGERDATHMTKLLMRKCRESGSEAYLYDSHFVVEALPKALQREYEEVVGALLPYSSAAKTVLGSAELVCNQGKIDLVQRNSDLGDEALRNFTAIIQSKGQNRPHSSDATCVLSHLRDERKLGCAFTAALQHGSREYATKVIKFDPDFDLTGSFDSDFHYFEACEAMDAALDHGFDDIAWKILIAGITSLNPRNPRALLLYIALKHKKPDFVAVVLEFGFNAEDLDQEEHSVLGIAIEWGDESILNEILRVCSRNAELYGADPWEYALRWATKHEDISLLIKLVNLGARPGDDLLSHTMEHHHSMVKPLLEQYIRGHPQEPTIFQKSIEWAILSYSEFPEFMDMLFDFGLVTGDALQRKGRRGTPLDVAIRWFQAVMKTPPSISLIKRLFDAGYDLDWRDFTGTTAFSYAINTKNPEIVQLFIDYGADINKPASFDIRRTPLQKAAEVNNLDIVRLLLDKGADVNAPPARFNGATALQFAAINGNLEMATLLLEQGAQLDGAPAEGFLGRSPLEGAAENGRLDMIKFLWNANSGPFDYKQCQRAMRLAERNGYLGCRDYIKQLMAESSSNPISV
ncbi:uncharacterized protein F4822DRAFT_222470 [Hypoxylon trugodes]|uniref:uncharacterized protein n=1 Tax=Hypoxylon trugodes TaxID=326681 RepID=UPI0021981343|nr:uncharacterized protein F4822DRAFT_222470 [Hypoxylon trugodes]KAI1390052.1 hypothetical protein F4822DRAFT_222470 [Hypoxylon trugodes]